MSKTSLHWFDYELPRDRIAKYPIHPRDACKLMIMERNSGKIEHRIFRDLINILKPGDVLVLNDSAVVKARLHGHRKDTEGRIECLLLEETDSGVWLALTRPAKRLTKGQRILFGLMEAEVTEEREEGLRCIRFPDRNSAFELMDSLGEVPLPPYIDRPVQPDDPENYQCIYARNPGSVAAPTAGLHFTSSLIEALKGKGIELAWITLHVGMGTFLPVRTACLEDHRMHEERYAVSENAARILRNAQREGRRIIAGGTTVVRALETMGKDNALLQQGSGRTRLFIKPGHEFNAIQGLLTNFHLPRSTLLVLVSAFAGREKTLEAYKEAVEKGYRFYSYGDAMLLL